MTAFKSTAAVFLMVIAATAHSQMLHPSIDLDDEQFCYFSRPTDVIGVMDGREGTLITPEGYLCSGFGEVMFFSGNPLQPVNQRVKTLLDGYLPVIQYQFRNEGVRYHFTMFAATLDGQCESPLMNFVRVQIRNESGEPRVAYFGAATRFQNEANTDWGIGDNRFLKPATPNVLGEYEQAGVEFNPRWRYEFCDDAFMRDSLVMYLFQTEPKPQRRIVMNTGYNEEPEFGAMQIPILPTTPVGVVKYRLKLQPGEERSLDFKAPYEPFPISNSNFEKLRTASFDVHLNQTKKFWENIFAAGIEISLPEEKVVDTFKASLVYSLIARDKIGEHHIQKVNEFQYDSFWLRDAAYFVRMYDVSGYHEIARQCLDFLPRWQRDDGNFLSQGGQYDGWGQTLWAYGQHYRIMRDREFAAKVYPSVKKAFAWLQEARRSDPLKVIPVTTPGDNENISGHVTGHNFWALAGLKNAIILAEALGQKEDAESFRQEYDDYHKTLMQHLAKITKATGGYIPPGLEGPGGSDWGNMLSAYPEQILDPHDLMVTATLNATRAKYQEGIMTYDYGRYLHHYLTMKNTETEIIRGDQQMAIEELYALLVHTSATHAGFEFSIWPWSTRDFGMNLAPHGWFAAKYRTLLRNMLLREEGNELHLLSCLSPEWVKSGKRIAVSKAPTNFGEVNFEMKVNENGATVDLTAKFVEKPEKLIVYIPWFVEVSQATADEKPIRIVANRLELPADARSLELIWQRRPNGPALNYANAVAAYKMEYRECYQKFLREGD